MKKSLIALASMAALAGAAHADVTLYGVIDVGVGTASAGLSSDVNNPANVNILPSSSGQTATTGRVTSMTNGVLQASRWGLKGTEDLGSGMKGMFTLESGLNIAGGNNPNDHALLSNASATPNFGAGDSSLNGQMFDREASVGLSGDFGKLTGGFQLNLAGEMNGAMDPLGAGYLSPLGFYGGLTGMNSSFTPRASNSLKYAYSMGATEIKGFYAMGGASGNAGAGSQVGLSVKGSLSQAFTFGLVAQRMNDNVAFGSGSAAGATVASVATGTGASTGVATPALTATYYNSTQTQLMAAYQATSQLKLFGGYLTETMSNPSDGAADLLITQNLGIPINSNAYSGINVNAYNTNYTVTLDYLGINYDLSNVSHLKAAYYHRTLGGYTKNTSATATQAYAQNGQNIIGIVYDYDLSKKTDAYLALNWTQYDTAGALAAGANPESQWVGVSGQSISFIGVGYRMKF